MSDVTDTLRGPGGTDLDRVGQTVASTGAAARTAGRKLTSAHR
jgi:hypothetical protein